MKKIFFAALFSVLLVAGLFGGGLTTSADTSESYIPQEKNDSDVKEEKEKYKKELSNLTKDEIISYFKKIDEEYEIGEAFSLKDQTFIEMYAKPVNHSDIILNKSKSINKKRTVNGITITVKGTIYDDIQNFMNQSFGANNLKTRTTAGSSKVNSVTTRVYHNAYGLVGSNGVGKVYSGNIKATGKNNTINSRKRYTGIVAYASTWYEVTVKHTGGTFTVSE